MNNTRANKGFTLVELLIAVAIMAIVGVISYQSLDASTRTRDAVQENMAELARVDRTWLLLEADIRNIVNHTVVQSFGPGSGDPILPFVAESGSVDYWLTLMRGGHANPLNFMRSELIRVGYRVEENTLFRDVWYNLSSVDAEQARQQKIIDGIESVELRILSPAATSFSAGPWSDRWPDLNAGKDELPIAIEVTLLFENQREMKRVFSIVRGA